MPNLQLKNLLEDSGLNEKEALVYLSSLELGEASILKIAQHSKIKRSTVYEIIPLLEQKGLIKTTKRGRKNYFVAENPKTVSKIIEEKEKRFKESLPELLALFNAQENKPKVFFYSGKEEVQHMYGDTLREGKNIQNFTSIINLYQYLDRKWVEDYIAERVKQNIKTNIIAVDSPEAREWRDHSKEELRDIKLIQKDNFHYSGDIQIYGNKVIITTYKNNIFGLLIEDENIAALLRLSFKIMWSSTQ